MKTKKVLHALLVAFLVFASIPACIITTTSVPSSPAPSSPPPSGQPPAKSTQPSATSPAGLPTRNSQVLGDLGSIAYTLDVARQVSETFDINTGKDIVLTAQDANGYGWMLRIPADALLSTTKITMTPFATIDNSKSGARIISGVQLEPDGLQFADAVQLSVTAPVSNPGIGLIFSARQDGSHVAFAPTTNSGKMAIAQVWHFSLAGYDDTDHSGQDVLGLYRKWAEEDYRLALDAAKQFIKNGPPPPPTSPSVSQFCRGTENNPEDRIQADLFEFVRSFMDPYGEYVSVLLAAIKNLQLVASDVDTTPGWNAAVQILQMAEKTIRDLGNQYQKDKPPDRLVGVIIIGLQIDHQIQLLDGEMPLLLFPEKITSWVSTIRDYYLNELKTRHDYRAFPTLLTLEKNVQLVGGTDRLEEILSAMTFEVVLDTSFNGSWKSSDNVIASGSVVQTADVKDLKMVLTGAGLWGDLNNLPLKAKSGTYTDAKESTNLAGMTDTGVLFLENWDPCVTKTFDVLIGGLYGNANSRTGTVAGPAAMVSFKQYYWEGATAFIFTIPIKNLDKNMGEQTFSGSGTAAEGGFTGSGKIHIVLKHTP